MNDLPERVRNIESIVARVDQRQEDFLSSHEAYCNARHVSFAIKAFVGLATLGGVLIAIFEGLMKLVGGRIP